MNIFLAAGTHEQPFDRLVVVADRLASSGNNVFVQFGYSRPPKAADGAALLTWQEMNERMTWANVVVCHGGPGTIWQAFAHGKIPVVFPREVSLGEHVDNHQVEFAGYLTSRMRVVSARTEDAIIVLISNYAESVIGLEKTSSKAAENRRRFKRAMDEWLT